MKVVGIDVGPELEAEATPVEAMVILKYLDSEGRMQIALRLSEGWTTWEVSGLLSLLASSMRAEFMGTLQDDAEDV